MSDEQTWKLELEEYIRQGEPNQAEKSAAWQTAIGLQAVDGLKTSWAFSSSFLGGLNHAGKIS